MQGRKLISLALLLLSAFSFAGAQSARKLKAEVIGLKLENHRLSTRIDSLELLLDSLQNVQVEESAQAAYVPDDSFVVSDSLLHYGFSPSKFVWRSSRILSPTPLLLL